MKTDPSAVQTRLLVARETVRTFRIRTGVRAGGAGSTGGTSGNGGTEQAVRGTEQAVVSSP